MNENYENKNLCPSPNLKCPNHGNCENCTSRHLRIGSLNYCAFYSILTELIESIKASPDSESAKVIRHRVKRQTNAYLSHMKNNGISEENLTNLRIQKAKISEH